MTINMDASLLQGLEQVCSKAEALLAGNLMPFWAKHAWDHEHGGFLTRLDRRGRRLEDHEKVLMMQVRMIHSLSAAHRHGLCNQGYLALANQGFDYLVANFWDTELGGFYYSVTRDGQPKCRRKNTDFHGYALTGLSEYYLASRREEARAWAERVFEVLMAQAADRDQGFLEDFDGGDWDALNAEQMNLGGRKDIKTIDMHTNILEGFMYLSAATGLPRHRQALREMLALIVAKGLHPDHGCTITAFDANWEPVADAQGSMTTSYGLNVELAWIMMDALEVLGEARDPYRGEILGLLDHALEFGFDHAKGGLASYGPPRGPVCEAHNLPKDRLLRPWWGQAELLNALVAAFSWTRDTRYAHALLKAFDWIERYQIDHECGDWYQEVHWETGLPISTDKGGEFKTSFHAGRALIRVAEGVRTLLNA